MSLGLPEVLAGAVAVALNAYVLMAGADFGGGLWDLVARGERRDAQQTLIARAIGPIWEANHVWLIVAIVLIFTAFPPAFATIGIVLHIPLTLMLVGIVLRGSAFVFRNYGSMTSGDQRRWGRVFAVASTATPIVLGMNVGALASGGVGRAAVALARTTPRASFVEVFVAPWWAPFPVAVGLLTLSLFAMLAAVYLTVEAPTVALREDFRRRAIAAAVAAFVAAVAALGLSPVALGVRLSATTPALGVQGAIALAALATIWALWRRRYRAARVAAAAQVSLILWNWALAQYPYVVPPDLTIAGAAAPHATLAITVAVLCAGGAILVPSLVYLFRTFAAVGGQPTRASDPSATSEGESAIHRPEGPGPRV